jgi:ATP-dependent RNA helicase DHX36
MAEEELLVRRNRQLRNKQRSWRESSEGEKMLAFRKTLPSYKERDALLAAISRNQVYDCPLSSLPDYVYLQFQFT